MARNQNPITLAASKVATAQARADKAEAAVVRLRVAENTRRDARASLDAARAELTALLNPPAETVDAQ